MNKKIFKILALVLLLTTFLSVSVSAENVTETDEKPTFKIANVTLKQAEGETVVSVPITFKGNITLAALQLEVSTPAGVEFVKFTNGDILDGIITPKEGVTPVVIPFIDITVKGVEVKSGTLAILEYKVPTSQVKDFNLLLTVEEAIGEEDKSIKDSFVLVNGCIKVESTGVSSGYVEEIMTSEERKSDVICMKIGKSTAISYGKKKQIDENDRKVVPYITNDRTMIPLRFVSETLGAEVLWEEGWDGCIVKKGDKEIKFTFGSDVFSVNGEEVKFDAPIEMLNDRTMVPVRFFAEQLGCDVYWEPINSLVVIAPEDNPWVPERKSEIRAINEMLISIYGIL